jgi:transposase
VVGVEQWAELRREHFVAGKSIKRLVRETGLSKNTIRRALRSETPPSYQRAPKVGILEAFKPEIHRLLRDDPRLTGVRVRELLEPLGCTAGKTVVDDYLREVRPLFVPPPRTFARGVWRPGEVCQFDVWQPRDEIPVGHGQTRPGWVVIACLGFSRAGAGVLVFSKQTEDLLAGISGCLSRLGALPQTLVWDRQAGLHAHRGRPTDAFAAFCGQLRVAWRFASRPIRSPKGQSSGCRPMPRRTSSPAAGSSTSSTSKTSSTPGVRRSTRAPTRPCANGRSTAWPRSGRRWGRCRR